MVKRLWIEIDENVQVAADSGCRFSPSCLSCPLPVCVHDAPLTTHNEMRREPMRQALLAGKLPEDIAAQHGVTIRTVYRVQRAMRQPA